jgi:hypothetical protein
LYKKTYFCQNAKGWVGIGGLALGSLLSRCGLGGREQAKNTLNLLPHFVPKAKRVIYLFQRWCAIF